MLSVCADQRRDSTHILFTKFHSDETEAIEFTNSMTQQDEPIKREISRRSTLCNLYNLNPSAIDKLYYAKPKPSDLWGNDVENERHITNQKFEK